MAFVVGVALIGVLVPQRPRVGEDEYLAWALANPAISAIAEALGLDHVFSTWWFVVGLGAFAVSLTVATVRMGRVAHARWAGVGERTTRPVPQPVAIETLIERAREHGYREVSSEAPGRRFARHRLGWWSSAVMHLGMVVAVVAALIASGFSGESIINLAAGGIREPGGPFLLEEAGIFGSPPEPGFPIRLDAIDAIQWPTGEVRELVATVSIQRDGETWETYEISANHPLEVDGYVMYVSAGSFGSAAFVELGGDGVPDSAVRIEFPLVKEGDASYAQVQPDGWPVIDARWDPTLSRDAEPLALRVSEGETVHQVVLDEGEAGAFGPYEAEFVFSGHWANFILTRPVAIDAVFLGFMIIGLGSIALYLFVPREFVVAEDEGGVRYAWRAARMPWAYRDELDAILGREGEDE